MINVPKLRVPFRITGGKAELVEQDSPEEVLQCVEAIVRTPVGSRLEEPEFGIPDLAFREGRVDEESVYRAISEREPRSQHTVEEDSIDELIRHVTIEAEVRG